VLPGEQSFEHSAPRQPKPPPPAAATLPSTSAAAAARRSHAAVDLRRCRRRLLILHLFPPLSLSISVVRTVRRKALDPVASEIRALRKAGLHPRLLAGLPPLPRSTRRRPVSAEQLRALVRLCAQPDATAADAEAARLALLPEPVAERRPERRTSELTGDVREDDYGWLRDDDRKNRDVISYLKEENEYTKALLADTEALQSTLVKEMRGRIQEADTTAPVRKGSWLYYSRTDEGKQYRKHCRRPLKGGADAAARPASVDDVADDAAGAEEVLLDEDAEAAALGKDAFFSVKAAKTSPDGTALAWTADTTGGEKYTLRVRCLTTGRDLLRQPIASTAGEVAWASDSKTLFYTTKDELDRPEKVWRHRIGDDSAKDHCVYHETDGQFYVHVKRSLCGSLIVATAGSAVTSETRVLRADVPESDFVVVRPREDDVEVEVVGTAPRAAGAAGMSSGLVVVLRDKARPNSEVLLCPAAGAPDADWTPLIPHRADVKLEDALVLADHLCVMERLNGLQTATVHPLPRSAPPPTGPLDASKARSVAFDEPSFELTLGAQGEWDSTALRLDFSSLKTPHTTLDVDLRDLETLTRHPRWTQTVPGYDSSQYSTRRTWAMAKDGTRVPISVLYRTDKARLDGTDPILIDCYGSYEIPNDPWFSQQRFSLVDRGVSFAIAHVRGGGELGRRWYEDGKFLAKMNTFTDLVACAEHLVSEKLADPRSVCASGRSAGGLTMGATVNLRPELFKAVVMGVPFLDVLTTMSDPSIPLTEIEWDEWGNPLESAEHYRYMKSYSPCDNVVSGAPYPHILITAGLHDPRVGYWEPAKHTALLRRERGVRDGVKPMLALKVDLGAGHFSKSGRFDRLGEQARGRAPMAKGARTHPARSPFSTTVSPPDPPRFFPQALEQAFLLKALGLAAE